MVSKLVGAEVSMCIFLPEPKFPSAFARNLTLLFLLLVDFYEMRRKNKVFEGGEYYGDYSPYGVMVPLAAHEGAGFFHCIVTSHELRKISTTECNKQKTLPVCMYEKSI